MQRLFSFKRISDIQRKLSDTSFLESHLCKNFVSLTEKCPKQLLKSSVTQPHSLSHFYLSSSGSWRSQCSVSEKVIWFLSNPAFLKKIVSNTHLKIRSNSFFDRGVRFLRSQLPRRLFEFNPAFNSSRRSWFPTADSVLLGLIVANTAVFILWRVADPTFMRKNFMISVDNITSGHVHTLITSAFSHKDLGHIVSNMIGLYFFGQSIGRLFGPEFLLKLYVAGAITGSIFFLVHHAFMAQYSEATGIWRTDPKRIPGLGASGAVNAIMLLNIFLFPTATLYLEFIIPVPAMLLGAFLIGKDILNIVEGNSEISGSAHLGGAVVAALAWARIKKRWI